MSGTSTDQCWAVIPAAGTGSRMLSDVPKQYLKIAGTTILEHSMRVLLDCEYIELLVLALSPDDNRAQLLPLSGDPRVVRVKGGERRSDSVLAGLQALMELASDDDWVLVHDAARPCVAPADIARLVCQVRETGVGGILASPIVDTVKRSSEEGLVVETLEREQLWAAQTPQMFRLGLLREALRNAIRKGQLITDEASAMELAGEPVQLIPASSGNIKITVPGDLSLAEFYLAAQNDYSHP